MDGYLEFGQVVYLKTDTDQRPRMVIAMLISSGAVQPQLASGTEQSWHFPIEISTERNILLTTNN
jgi:hypothetical protein